MINNYIKTNRLSHIIVFIILVASVFPYMIMTYVYATGVHENNLMLVLFIISNLIFLYGISKIISQFIFDRCITSICTKHFRFKHISKYRNLYNFSSKYLLVLFYFGYLIVVFYSHQYYLLIMFAFLFMNLFNHVINNKLFLFDKKLMTWNLWYLDNKFNFVTSYKKEPDGLILVLESKDKLKIHGNEQDYEMIIDVLSNQ